MQIKLLHVLKHILNPGLLDPANRFLSNNFQLSTCRRANHLKLICRMPQNDLNTQCVIPSVKTKETFDNVLVILPSAYPQQTKSANHLFSYIFNTIILNISYYNIIYFFQCSTLWSTITKIFLSSQRYKSSNIISSSYFSAFNIYLVPYNVHFSITKSTNIIMPLVFRYMYLF